MRVENEMRSSKNVQLEILMNRIILHGNRMWQLPLSYFGIIAISLNAIFTKDKSGALIPEYLITASLAILGLLITLCLHGAAKRYKETVENSNELERELQLEEYTKWDCFHTSPYYAVMIFGIIICIAKTIFLIRKCINSDQVCQIPLSILISWV